MSAEFDKAKELFDAFKEVKIEYTPFAGGRTEYSELNYREKKQCALILANFLLPEYADRHPDAERYMKKVITIIENDELN